MEVVRCPAHDTMRYHEPVLLQETMEYLNVSSGKRYIDATLGGGGHTAEILRRGGSVLGIDTDKDALDFVHTNIAPRFPQSHFVTTYGNFKDIKTIALSHAWSPVDGVLFDLGVSSWQFDQPERGFSYRFSQTPLDLRLDQSQGAPAVEYVNTSSEEDLYEIISTFGEEERARSISRAFLSARKIKKITTADDVKSALSLAHISPTPELLSRIYQALRIAVNDELNVLDTALRDLNEIVVKNGRVVILSYHSLEDRKVKRFFTGRNWKELTKKPIMASQKEIQINRRARSAKLRAAEKLT